MVIQRNNTNLILGLLFSVGLVCGVYEAYQYSKVSTINRRITNNELIKEESFPYLQKYSSAYHQGNHNDYKHAVQTYGQLLELSPPNIEQSKIQYNIANNLFIFGLIRRVNEDGTLQDEARYAYTQAKLAYEQSLRINPNNRKAKFNLSVLHSVMANKMKPAPKDRSTMELSNLPIGLP